MIEADSLSSLNLLAANPPRYPVNPTDTPRDPLTLYISRVPGTRDVILSTLKPQRKNVTFEDVANALYYIHLDVPADALHHQAQAASQAGSSPASITRKPVPSALPPVVVPPLGPADISESTSTSATAPPVLAPTSPVRASTEVTRRPVPAPVPVLQPPVPDQPQPEPLSQPLHLQQSQAPTRKQSITRKPLGPRPLNPLSPLSDHERSLLPPLPPRPQSLSVNASSLPPSPTQRSPTQRSPTHSSPRSAPFQLTVIRRDPVTNHQWNIGKVIGDGQDVAEALPLQTAAPTSTNANPNIKIVLETSGYAKFRDASDDVFHRDVAMAYGKSWTAGLRKVKDVLRDVTRPRGSSMTGEALFDRNGERSEARNERSEDIKSEDTKKNRHSFDGRLDKGTEKGTEKDDMKPKGYAFASPWDGRCEFRTGNGGRSLKLRHILGEAAHSAGGYNPLTIVQGLKDGQGLNSIPGNVAGRARAGSLSSALVGAVPVSELRFNLPSGDLFGHKRSKSSSSHSEYTDDEEEEYSLDLGRERAGGGNRGKRAKLGKLIVYDDGFKMLDLVVAANVGVWWVSWEKVF